MNNIREMNGDLITLAKEGFFDVITHGCNCFCTMGAGIAVPMKNNFGCDTFKMEAPEHRGSINKLGTIDYEHQAINIGHDTMNLIIVNSYTQYCYGVNHADGDKKPVDYDAIALCMKKINHTFPGKTIGLPMIGAGLAGGDWAKIQKIIETELNRMDVIIVKYKK